MKYILATKKGMTQFFDEAGNVHPATVLSAGPVVVTQVKAKEKDGYRAIQVGYGAKKKLNKAQRGHFRGLGSFRHVKEFRIRDVADEIPERGNVFDVSAFEAGNAVTVRGTSKGKGFAGVVKRHGFGGGPRSHGQKHSEREPGSIGATGPQRVFKGKKMAGRMGGERVAVGGLAVLAVDKENNELLISGAVPGRRGSLIEVRSANAK